MKSYSPRSDASCDLPSNAINRYWTYLIKLMYCIVGQPTAYKICGCVILVYFNDKQSYDTIVQFYSEIMAIAVPSASGGYENEFVDAPPDTLVCKLCIHPCRNPYLSVCCGHNFCKSCLDSIRRAISNCPICRNEEFTTFPNKLSDREIRNLHVMCTNKERGCEWQGELNDLNNHLGNSDGCQFEDVLCSNECGKMLQRQYLTSHVETECPCRKVDCQHCHITGGNQFIEGEHKEQCPKLPLPCPNSCTVSCPNLIHGRKRRAHKYQHARKVIRCIPREDMEEHKKECLLQEVECSHHCGKTLQRQYLTGHIEIECPRRNIDCYYCHITGEYQFIEGEHEEQCPKLPLLCPNNCEVGSVPREDMEAHRKECPLEMVQCEYHNVGCEERMMRKRKREHEEEKMEQHLSLTKHRLTDNHQELSLTKAELANTQSQLASVMEQINTLMVVLHQTAGCTSHTSGAVSTISVAQWWAKLTGMSLVIKSGDQPCPVTMSITGFNENKRDQIEWYSDPFCSHDNGYKMCLRVDPDGILDGVGTHLSVFLYLMKGPHDDELTWPLRGKFEVKLLNQISDSEHRSVTVAYNDIASDSAAGRVTVGDKGSRGRGHPLFISHKDLRMVTPTCQYLKDDCIFLQVSKLQT